MRWLTTMAGLLAILCAGCWFGRPTSTSGWLDKLLPFSGPAGGDIVVLDIALLETMVGDRYLNQEMWTGTDELFLSPEARSIQEENGLRLALIHGRAPSLLQTMLQSERHNSKARQRRLRAGDSSLIEIGSVRERLTFELRSNGRSRSITCDQALCQLQVVATIGKDDKVNLQITPQVQHYDQQRMPRLSPTTSLALHTGRVTDPYPTLRLDVAIGVNESAVLGCRFDKPQSLGFQFFVEAEAERPTQRLLVIRAARVDVGAAAPTAKTEPATRNLTLASQASLGP